MTIYRWLIVALWLAFLLYWASSAIGAKRSVGGRAWRREAGLRLILIMLVVLVLHVPATRHVLRIAEAHEASGALAGIVGVTVCALGIGLAILARFHLGRNWGMPMSRKDDPELVTTGPYAVIRHPIYTGMLLAMLGSAIAVSVLWGLPLLLFGAYFVYSAVREERLMTQQFPQEYPAYRKRTWMLLPFLL